MKAAFIKRTGDPSVIEYGDLPKPLFKENEVLVKVSAVAVNPVDTYFRSGKYPDAARSMPYIIGCDAVGTVAQIGKAVTMFKPGQRVWTINMSLNGSQGSFSEYLAVDEAMLYPAPEHVDDITLVAVVHSAATACVGLIRAAKLKASETIFVNGGAGSVGSAIIQLAVARGAKVIASTHGREKTEWCKSIGAELVLDYKDNNYAEKIKGIAPQGIDVFWDTSRQPDFEMSVPLLARRGRIVLMAGHDSHPTLPVGQFYAKECSLKGFTLMNASALELRGSAEIINRCLEDDRLKAKIKEVLPLSDAAKAHAMIESEPDLWGKIVLKP